MVDSLVENPAPLRALCRRETSAHLSLPAWRRMAGFRHSGHCGSLDQLQWRDSDLLFAIGFSVAAFQLMFPFQIYNEVPLLPAVLWLLLQRRERRRRSQLFTLLLSCLWIVLGSGWTSALD